MKKAKIYTRTGDQGETALVSGKRISKGDSRIDLYGELDELNSRLGVVCASLDEVPYKVDLEFLHQIQSVVFDLGSNLACEPENRSKYKLPQVSTEIITGMEKEIDRLDQELPSLKNFILPGGSLAAAHIHLARTCARKTERQLISFQVATGEELPENSAVFLNRLSDYLFVLARYVNLGQNGHERTWQPRQ